MPGEEPGRLGGGPGVRLYLLSSVPPAAQAQSLEARRALCGSARVSSCFPFLKHRFTGLSHNKDLLSSYYVPNTGLGLGNTIASNPHLVSWGAERRIHKQL